MSEDPQLRATIAVAFRHFTDEGTTVAEQNAILATTAQLLGGPEGELAARILHHRREEQSLQLELGLLFQQSLKN